jgi:hypothetical protein
MEVTNQLVGGPAPEADCEHVPAADEHADTAAVTPPKRPLPPKRVDIQVMRALAVTLVVLYHLDLEQFKGGFIGVDIFFVISGYLVFGSLVTSPSMSYSSVIDRDRDTLHTTD